MKVGPCPNCGVQLRMIFADPTIESGYKRAGKTRFVGIEKYIADHAETISVRGYVLSREVLLADAEECPGCGGLIAAESKLPAPADILGRRILPGEVSLEVHGG